MTDERCCPVAGREADVEFVDAIGFAALARKSDQFGWCENHKRHWARCGERVSVATPPEVMRPSKPKLSPELLALLEGYAG